MGQRGGAVVHRGWDVYSHLHPINAHKKDDIIVFQACKITLRINENCNEFLWKKAKYHLKAVFYCMVLHLKFRLLLCRMKLKRELQYVLSWCYSTANVFCT